MDRFTEGVTIFAGAIEDVLKIYADKKQDYKELFDLAKGYDISKPTNKIPIVVYTQMCDWIESKLGKFSLIRIGRNIGESTYDMMLSYRMIEGKVSPMDVMKALILTSHKGVQGPQKAWLGNPQQYRQVYINAKNAEL